MPGELRGARDDRAQHRLEIERRAHRLADLAQRLQLVDRARELRRCAPRAPLNSRTFSIAITAWSAKVCSSAICVVGERSRLRRGRRVIAPIGLPSRSRGTPSTLRKPADVRESRDRVVRVRRGRPGSRPRAASRIARPTAVSRLERPRDRRRGDARDSPARHVRAAPPAGSASPSKRDDVADVGVAQLERALRRWCRTPAARRSATG